MGRYAGFQRVINVPAAGWVGEPPPGSPPSRLLRVCPTCEGIEGEVPFPYRSSWCRVCRNKRLWRQEKARRHAVANALAHLPTCGGCTIRLAEVDPLSRLCPLCLREGVKVAA